MSDQFKFFLKANKSKLKKLSTPNIWISLYQILFEYFCIGICIFICIKFWSTPLYILSVMFIGARQHELGVLMHDATHFLLCKNKKLNELICNIFISYPLFFSLSKYRQVHFSHHKHTSTDEDPDWGPRLSMSEWHFPQSKVSFIKNLFQYCFYIHVFKIFLNTKLSFEYKINYFLRSFIPIGKVNISNFKKILIGIVFCVIIALSFYFKIVSYFFLFWVFPVLFWIPFINRFRQIAEHFGIKGNSEFNKSRIIYPTLLDKIFLGVGWNVTYHLDHHIYPKIPCYNLKKLHKLLLDCSEYREKAHITKNGFFGVYKECTL
jgi:fatty acid desaturase